MQLELMRFLFLVLPYVFCSTLSALIIFAEDIKKLFPKLIIYSLLASLTQTLTYQIDYVHIQFLLEVATGFLVAYFVFKNNILWVFKIYAASYILGIIYICGLTVPATLMIFSQPYADLMNNPVWWITLGCPANVLMVVIVYIIRKTGVSFKIKRTNLGYGLERPYPIFIAILIQLIIFTGLGAQVLKQTEFLKNNFEVAITFIIILIAILTSFYIILKHFQQTNLDITINSQEAVSENIMELINSVRGQRHDFLNHLQVVYGMAHQNKTEEVQKYLGNLLQEVSFYNEILKIDNPIISALINAKVSQANLAGVNIHVDIQSSFTAYQATAMNIARIMANLIDNAVDAVLIRDDEVSKDIEVIIFEQGPVLICKVVNLSTKILNEEEIFDPGFSSKDEHDGLGLYNCRKLAEKLHGSLRFMQEHEQVSFTLIVPRQGSKD